MLRKITVAVSVIFAFVFMCFNGTAKDSNIPIGIYVNEKEIKTDVSPYIENGTTFVPIRAICNALSIDDIVWNEASRTVLIKAESEVQFTIDQSYAFKDGKKYNLNAPVKIKGDRTMIPVRFLTEAVGASVEWDGTYYCVNVWDDDVVVDDKYVASEYDRDDVMWLSRLIEAESAGEPVKGQIAVGNVVLNRLKSPDYPNTIYGVIFDKKHGVQFQPVANGKIYNTPSKTCVSSAKRAMSGENYAGNCMFFLNESIATNTWIVNNREYFTTIHNHSFYV